MSISRRTFLISTGVVGGALVVGFSLSGDGEKAPYPIDVEDGAFVPNAFLQILPDNSVRFYTARDEMGQGVTTGLATLVGEELDYDPLNMDVRLAGVHEDYNNPGMGMQMTGGSNAINAHYTQLREAGARTWALIVAAAAKDLGVSPGDIATDSGHVVVGGERHPYGNFVATAAALPVPDPETELLTLKSPDEFRYIGRESGRVDSIAKATGTAEFGIDVDVPGMHYAVVVRSPVAGASLKSVDKAPAENMAGVTNVVEVTTGVAVVARKYWQAKTAAAALEPSWSDMPLGQVDNGVLRSDLRSRTEQP